MNTLLYTFTLGMLAAVNPCGFPLLPAYLEFFVGGPAELHGSAAAQVAGRAVRAVTAAAWATVGFLVLFGALGLVAQLGWSSVIDRSSSVARYVMVAVGVGMVGLGVMTLAKRSLKINLPTPGSGAGLRRPAALAIFGFSYGIASIGCALPLFVGGVTASFGRSGSLRGVTGLLTYAVGMGAVLGALALAIAVAGPGAGRYLRRAGRLVPAAGGLLLILVGAYLSWYWLTDILTPGRSSWMERVVEHVQLDIADPINAHARLIGAILGAALIAALVAGGLAGSKASAGQPAEGKVPAP